MNQLKAAILCIPLSVASGCATITSSDTQDLNLTTSERNGTIVEKAKCTLKNDKGQWEAETPAIVSVHRSSKDLSVECEKPNQNKGLLKAISRAAGGMFGNVIIGGGIGAIIDHSTGKGYNYPDELPVVMGESVVVDRKSQNESAKKEAPDRPEVTSD